MQEKKETIGSAFGARGLTSRLYRHLRKKKKRYWHIDQITTSEFCEIQSIGIIIDRKIECEVSEKISKIDFIESINGFALPTQGVHYIVCSYGNAPSLRR